MSPDRLVYMANQIAGFFVSQGHDHAVAGTLDHLRKFWDPRMRAEIIELMNQGTNGLTPVACEAVREMSRSHGSQSSRTQGVTEA